MNTSTVDDRPAAERLTSAIDQFVYRRLAQLTASEFNAKERLELAERSLDNLRKVLSEVLP